MNVNEATLAANRLGHALEREDPSNDLSSVTRWTCTKCGRSVLKCGANYYGSATETLCSPDNQGGDE